MIERKANWRDHLVLTHSMGREERTDEEVLLENIEQYLRMPSGRSFAPHGLPFDWTWSNHQKETLLAVIGYLEERNRQPVHLRRNIKT